jgi:hypothetical protein
MSILDLLRRRIAAPTMAGLTIGLAILLALGLASCDDDLRRQANRVKAELEPYFDHAHVAPIMLRSEVLNDGDGLGIPQRLLATESHLVVSDRGAVQRLHVFDRATGDRLASFGPDGRGPGEFTHAPEISTVAGEEDLLYAYDGNTVRITRLGLPAGTIVDFGDRSVLPLPTDVTVYGLAMLEEHHAVGLGLFRAARLGFFDLADGSARHAGPLPSEDPLPFHVVQMAHLGFLAVHPTGDRIAVLSRQGSRVEIYDARGETLVVTEGPHPFPVDYEIDRAGHLIRGPRNRNGYQGAAASADRLFALFSGRAEAHFPGESGRAAEFVHVFDWEGGLERVYRLDREVRAIALDPTGTMLYAVTHAPEPALLRFPLM